MIVGFVEGQSLKLDTPVLVSDSVNFLTAVFHFSPDWESLPEKWLHFASGEEGYTLQLREGRITADMGLNLPAGEWEVYLHGVEEDDSGNVLRRATTETVRLYVQDFAGYEGEGFPDAPPGLVGELERELQALREGQAAVQTLAEGHAARHKAGGADALSPEDIGAGRVNPNLLHNWYFGNPVNQRGQTEYTGAGYTIDRWAGNSAETVVTVTESGITLVGSGAIGFLRQPIEHQEQYLGKKVTLSVLFASGEFSDSTGLIPLAATSENTTVCRTISYNSCYVALVLDRSGRLYTQFRCGADTSNEIQAVKLELGTQQTLAHQENGVWVLNEIPDYNEELLKCCMSTADSSDTYANNKRTPAAINAVNKAGDTMTGDLHVYSGAAGASFYADRDRSGNKYSANVGVFPEGNPYFGRRKDNSMQSYIILEADKLRFNSETAGIYSTVLHTGNKPSGSYTGNGSAAARTINTGGIGSALVIWSNAGMCIVTPGGALCKSGASVSAIDTAEVSFKDGVLTIASAEDLVNGAGYTYTYQVL